jgi:predicted dehydrogenase
MSETIKVAIIGAGIGREHLAGYKALPDRFQVVTICDIDTARAEEICGGDKAISITSEFDSVLANEDIDLIDICLPPHLHFDMSMKALAAGKHVVCEKPLVNSLREADLLAEQAKKYGKLLFPVFQYRFGPALSKLKALIDAGLAGKPLVASIETHWNREADYYANPWRGTWKGEQGGAILGHAIHNHDLLCAIFGGVAKLNAFVDTRVNDIEVEDCASISFVMESGALATSSITLGAATDTSRLRFVFENLTATSGTSPYRPAEDEWTFEARGSVTQADVDAVISKVDFAHAGFAGFFEALADCLQNDGKNAVLIEDGRRSLEIVSMMYQSARSCTPVQAPIKEGDAFYNGWAPAD